jgi:hypothetical protein
LVRQRRAADDHRREVAGMARVPGYVACHRVATVTSLGAALDRLNNPAQRVIMIVANRHGDVVLLVVANDRMVSSWGSL